MSSNISADLVCQSSSFPMNFMNIIGEIPLVVNCYFPYVLFCALVKGGGGSLLPWGILLNLQAWPYAVNGIESKGLKSQRRNYSYIFIAPESSVWVIKGCKFSKGKITDRNESEPICSLVIHFRGADPVVRRGRPPPVDRDNEDSPLDLSG